MATKLKRVTTDWNETVTYEITVQQNCGGNPDFDDSVILINSPTTDVGLPLGEFLAVYAAMTKFIEANKLKVP